MGKVLTLSTNENLLSQTLAEMGTMVNNKLRKAPTLKESPTFQQKARVAVIRKDDPFLSP